MTTSISEPPHQSPLASPSAGLRHWLTDRSQALGFDVCGVAAADAPWLAGGRLEDFVAQGRYGQMEWMRTTLPRRAHPTGLWPQARTAIVLGMNYGPDEDPLALLEAPTRGAVSVYARGRDYHSLIKGRLKSLATAFGRRSGGQVKVFVDTAPLMEKPLAQRAGLGWQGKHTNLVSREFGSWLFLGVVLTDVVLEPDAPAEDHCGACRACLDICPTNAFTAPYQLDARRCISYLTIEHDGPVPEPLREAIGNRIYGCDDCLAVCPWNKFASQAKEVGLQARQALRAPALRDLATLDDGGFRKLFSAGPVKRMGHERFIRNVLYAIGNSGDTTLSDLAQARLADSRPTVRDAATWALQTLARRVVSAPK